MKKTTISILFSFLLFSSCAKLILSVGGQLSNIDQPEKFYSTLGLNKTTTESLGKKIKDFYDGVSKDGNYTQMTSKYDEIKNDQRKLIESIAKKIKKGKEIKFDDFNVEFKVVEGKIKELENLYANIESGFSSNNEFLLGLAKDILKSLAKEAAINLYIKKFKSEYSITDFNKLEVE